MAAARIFCVELTAQDLLEAAITAKDDRAVAITAQDHRQAEIEVPNA